MKLTKTHKIYGSVLGVALVGLMADRTFLSPDSAAGAPSTAASVASPTAAPSAVMAVPESELPTPPPAYRFERQAAGVDPTNVPDAFRAAWVPLPDLPTAVEVDSAPGEADFRASHRLTAVMAHDDGGYASINGRTIRVGQLIDGYTLQSVGDRTATLLGLNGAQVELALSKPRLGADNVPDAD